MTQKALKLALEALEEAWYHVGTFQPTEKAIDLYDEARAAIKEALAQTQEPKIGCVNHDCEKCKAQRTWVGLTEDERDHLAGLHLYAVKGQVEAWIEGVDDFAQAIEAKLKQKNGYAEGKNNGV